MTFHTNLFLPFGICTALLAACGPTAEEDTDADTGDDSAANNQPVAIAQAPDQVAQRFLVELDATDSTDEDGNDLSYQWRQIAGADVTEGVGYLTGAQASFYAPSEVNTLQFDLVVNDGTDDSEPESVRITVLENTNAAYFVDGDLGNDTTGIGSQDRPFASIAYALCQLTDAQEDIYVKNRADDQVYDETTDPCLSTGSTFTPSTILTVPTGTSLYGGFDDNWHRDVTEKTLVDTLHHGFIFDDVDEDAWFSGFNVYARDPDSASSTVTALSALGGTAHFYVEDNQLLAGDVPADLVTNPGSSIALAAGHLENISISRNVISSGSGGNASSYGLTYSVAAERGTDGSGGENENGGSGGDGKGVRVYDGGSGGKGGLGAANNAEEGNDGDGKNNTTQGTNGALGAGGSSVGTLATVAEDAWYECANGSEGSAGVDGRGGDGGDGGDRDIQINGGGGGGGGGGGQGGGGGVAGVAGCASIGVLLTNIPRAVITANTIFSSTGGDGGSGGIGQTGGDGGNGGEAGSPECRVLRCGGNGSDGDNGTKGGDGGRGGAGGGGPSIGVLVGPSMSPHFELNTITARAGGTGGDGGDDGNGGAGGHSYAVYDADLDDGMIPTMTNNTLNSDKVSLGGSSFGTLGTHGASGGADSKNW